MSSRRKITVSSSISSRRSRSNERESEFQGLQPPRPSVFSRLGTIRSTKRSPASSPAASSTKLLCRNILDTGTCQFGTKCKYVSSHKIAQRQREDQKKTRKRPLHGSSPKVDTDWQNWNEESLDYEDERMLEKKRLLLQRELEKEHDQVPPTLKEAPTKPQPEPPAATAAAVASSSSSSSSSSDSTSSTSSDNSSDDEEQRSVPSKKNKKSNSTKRAHKRNASSTESEEGSKKSNKLDKEVTKKSISKKKSRGKDVKKQSKRKKVREVALEKKKDSPSKSNDKPTPTAIVDKFGFYHSQQPSSSSSAVHEGLKEGTSKRSTSSDRRQQNSPVQSKKRKRRSSGSPLPRKRKSSPCKSKQSYIAATSRSGNVGKGGDRDLRERRVSTRKKSSLSPQRSSRKKGKGHKKAQLTGANSEPVDNRRTVPADRGLKRNRSKSDERLLPPQALQQKNTPRRPSSERSSTKNSRERTDSHRSPAAESRKCLGESDGGELSATEDFSEIGESDEEIFNQHNEEREEEEEEDMEKEEREELEENVPTTQDTSFNEDKLKESDLLEGISEEELDVSDEEKDQKVKIADALGVDWSQLITPKESKKSQSDEPGTFRKQWTPAAIFSRIGLPKSLLGSEEYEAVIKEVNEQGQGTVEILHPIPTVHCYLFEKKKQDEKNLQRKRTALCA